MALQAGRPGGTQRVPGGGRPTARGSNIIEAAGLSKQFGSTLAVARVDLAVQPGTILGLIGPSGCGKTTTVRLLTGVYEPTTGEVRVMGKDPRRLDRKERRRLGYLPQHAALVPELTVQQNLRFLSTLMGIERRQRRRRTAEVLDLVDLGDHRKKTVGQLSGGMQRRLALASTLAHDPLLVFLDEPTAGIDPILRERFWQRFQELAHEGRTLVVTTQYVGEAADCDVVGILVDGWLAALDTPQGLVRQAYGGELAELACSARLDPADIRRLEELEFVTGRATWRSATNLALPVDDVSLRMNELISCVDGMQLPVDHVQAVAPDYDDVFVVLVEAARARRADAEAATAAGHGAGTA